ncbi:MAG: YraN family protein [Clostridia bacterium]|nr:YraN family protein [Clostridia bacterium]
MEDENGSSDEESRSESAEGSRTEKNKKTPSKRSVGAKGESAAARYLRKQGYRIIGKNFRAAHGEIDIIAYDRRAKRTVFVEVKSRKDSPELIARYGRAADAVNYRKRSRFISAMLVYQKQHPESVNSRIDIVEVYFPLKPRLFSRPRIVHLRAAFGMEAYAPGALRKRR